MVTTLYNVSIVYTVQCTCTLETKARPIILTYKIVRYKQRYIIEFKCTKKKSISRGQ